MGENVIESIKKMLKNTSVKNGIWMYIYHFLNAIVPMMTIPYITRVLGAGKYGVFSIAVNVINYLQVIVEYGFSLSGTRKIAMEKEDDSKLYSTVIQSRLFLFSICILISVVYIFINRSKAEVCQCLTVLLLAICGYCLESNWFFQGKQDMKWITIINIAARTVSTILIFLLVKEASDILIYCVLFSISPLISGILGVIISVTKYKLRLQRVKFAEIWNELKDGWYVFTTQFSTKVFGVVGITFLGIFAVEQEVGIYSAINKIPNTLIMAWTPVSQVIYPIASKKYSESWRTGVLFVNRVRKYILPITILASAVVAVFSNRIVAILFGAEYADKSYWVIPLLVWMNLSINNGFVGVHTLLASGHDKKYSKCFQIGVAFTVMINFLLIVLFHGDGAAFAPMTAELFLYFLLRAEVRKCNELYGV